jgi:hypothetical protein
MAIISSVENILKSCLKAEKLRGFDKVNFGKRKRRKDLLAPFFYSSYLEIYTVHVPVALTVMPSDSYAVQEPFPKASQTIL